MRYAIVISVYVNADVNEYTVLWLSQQRCNDGDCGEVHLFQAFENIVYTKNIHETSSEIIDRQISTLYFEQWKKEMFVSWPYQTSRIEWTYYNLVCLCIHCEKELSRKVKLVRKGNRESGKIGHRTGGNGHRATWT